MITFEGLKENFRFIVLEVLAQANATTRFLESPTEELYNKIVSRDDYIDNLKNIVENNCFSKIHTDKRVSKKRIDEMRSIQIMCVNLERIADFCVNVVRQMSYLSDSGFLQGFDYKPMLSEITKSMSQVLPAQTKGDLGGALSICRSEFVLDQMYKSSFDRIMAELASGRSVNDLITVLFIFRYLERIGDALLNIGEALLFFIIGEKVKIEQFQALQQTLTSSGFTGSISDIDFRSFWGTRSGCRISKVGRKDPTQEGYARESVYKEGNPEKIRKEKENIEKWSIIFPGLGPRVFSYREEKTSASLLVEFLHGCTLDELILTVGDDALDGVFVILEETLREVWETTRNAGLIKTDYVGQIQKRMDKIREVHPEFFRHESEVGSARVDGSERLLDRCARIENDLHAPFSVFIHGDFNTNNIVFDNATERIHFVDLLRSADGDYVQDASVFVLSNFRMPVFEEKLRGRLNRVIGRYYDFIAEFAQENGDETLGARMAFGLARSFYTSTRFEMNFDFAKEMYLRAHFLLEKIVHHDGRPWNEFQLPASVLYY